ncbi:hypothetical protein HYY75_04395 [bacterium]|nr:hypothetical protein [bacterium]
MRRFGLSQRVIFGTIVISLLTIWLMGITLERFSGLLSAAAHLRVADDVISMGSQVQDDLLDLLQTQETFDQYISEQTWRHYFEFSRRISTLLDRVRDLRPFRKQTHELNDLDSARIEMSGVLMNATYTINPSFTVGAISADTLRRLRTSRSRLHQQIRALLLQEREYRKVLETGVKQQIDSMKTTMISIVSLLLISGICSAIYLHKAAIAPLNCLMLAMRSTDENCAMPVIQPSGAPEMRELIESFNQMGLSLSRNQKRLSSLLSLAVAVAHEVRNPIAAIGTAIQALEAGYPKEGPDKDIFKEILKEVFRLNNITTDLLVFAKPKPLIPEIFKVSELVEEVRVLMKSVLAMRKIELELFFDEGSNEISADRNQFHRILLNLLTNSVDAIGESGKILIKLEPASLKGILVSIEDSGPGIPEEKREKIFQPFFSTKTKGAGLGLAIVYDMVEQHGGHICVLPGKVLPGARFEIELPREPKAD